MHRGALNEVGSSSWSLKTGRELEDKMQLSCGMPATLHHKDPVPQLLQASLLSGDALVAKQAGGAWAGWVHGLCWVVVRNRKEA